MDEKIKAHLKKYAKEHGWSTDDDTLVEIACEDGILVHREEFENHRWWVEYLYVRDINGMFICHYDAETSGDTGASERGYKFDASTICEMRPVKKTITVYEPV